MHDFYTKIKVREKDLREAYAYTYRRKGPKKIMNQQKKARATSEYSGNFQ